MLKKTFQCVIFHTRATGSEKKKKNRPAAVKIRSGGAVRLDRDVMPLSSGAHV